MKFIKMSTTPFVAVVLTMTVGGFNVVLAAEEKVVVSVSESFVSADFSFAPAETDRNIYIAYGGRDGGSKPESWEFFEKVAVAPSGSSSVKDVALPLMFREKGYVMRAFLDGRIPAARDYVQDGLVAHFDALENAGDGVHSDSVEAWKNLAGDNDLPIDTAAGDVIGADNILIGKKVRSTSALFSQRGEITLECGMAVLDYGANSSDTALFVTIPCLGALGWDVRENMPPLIVCAGNGWGHDDYRWASSEYSNLKSLVADGKYQYCSFRPALFVKNSAEDGCFSVNGVVRNKNWQSDYGTSGTQDFFMNVGSLDGNVRVRSIRVYSRTLTTDEQIWNYKLDQIRYEGSSEVCTADSTAYFKPSKHGFILLIR